MATINGSLYDTREAWLEAAMSELSPAFAEAGFPLPDRIRVTCGFGSGGTRKKKNGAVQVGECWPDVRSGDASFEIMVSPIEDDPVSVLAILTHELCHAADGCKNGHRAHSPFATLARALHLEGKLTATFAGDAFKQFIAPILRTLGAYPHAALDTSTRPKQGTRMIKCVCPACGYTVRTTHKWLAVGQPLCPKHSFLLPEGN